MLKVNVIGTLTRSLKTINQRSKIMANPIYYGVVRDVGEDNFELHVSHIADDVIKTNALSKRVPCTLHHYRVTVGEWHKEMRERFGAIEILSFTKEVN